MPPLVRSIRKVTLHLTAKNQHLTVMNIRNVIHIAPVRFHANSRTKAVQNGDASRRRLWLRERYNVRIATRNACTDLYE